MHLGRCSDAIIGIMAAVAQQERIRISDRTKAGMARAKAKGKRFGRRVKPGCQPSRTTLWRRRKRAADMSARK